MKKRNESLDISRAICMLWIVGIWHLQEYFIIKNPWNNPYTKCITVSALSMFTFLSGYFLSGKTKNMKDCIQFYQKRLLRFYPLFLVACLSLFGVSKVIGATFFRDFQQLFLTLVGLSCLKKPYPGTVWYFAMLILFYFVTPFINRLEREREKVIVLVSLYFLLIISVCYGQTDTRVLIYFPIYMGGLFGKRFKVFLTETCSGIKALFSTLAWGISIIICVKYESPPYLQLVVAALAIAPLYYVGTFLKRWNNLRKLFLKLGYASMCAYLFHRQFYSVLKVLIGDFTFITAYLFAFPILLIISYAIQKIYDAILIKMKSHRY